MKSRLAAASISMLFSSGTRGRNIRDAISSRSIVSLSGSRHSSTHSGFQSQKFQSSSGAVQHSDTEDDDGFSELGPERSTSSTMPIRLATEKVDHFLTGRSRRESGGRSPSSENRPKIKDIVATIVNSSPTLEVEHRDRRRASVNDTETMSDTETPHSVTIKNIPPKVGLSELIEGISVFGKVSGASFVNASKGLKCCSVKFENADSSRKAILAGKIIVGNQVFPVHHPDPEVVIAVRIENINKMTGDHVVHTRCKSAGSIVGIARRSKDVVDVYFNASNQITVSNILKKLNNTTVDQSRWSACLHSSKSMSSSVLADEECGEQLGMQIYHRLIRQRKELQVKKVYWQDLMNLHVGIMHIADLPFNAEASSNK